MNEEFTESEVMTLNDSNTRERMLEKLKQVWRDHQVGLNFQDIFIEHLKEASVSRLSELIKQ
jgi:hypothetical protein